MKRLLVAAVALVALAVPAQASAEVTIKLGSNKYGVEKYREVLYPDTFRIKGKTGTYRGPVALEVDDFPYDGGGEVATVETDENGEYVFPKVALRNNSKVRVRAGIEFSKTIELYVHPGVKLGYRTVSNGQRVKVSFTYIGHPGFAPPENNFFVYILIRGKDRVRRLSGPRSMTKIGDGRWRFADTLNLPRSRRVYRYFLLFCTRGLSASGYGRAYAIDRSCGKKAPDLGNGL